MEHRPQAARDAQKALRRDEALEVLASHGVPADGPLSERTQRATAAERRQHQADLARLPGEIYRLAVALRATSDPHHAAALAAVPDDGELAGKIQTALGPDYADLRGGEKAGTVRLLSYDLAMLAARMVTGVHELPPTSIPAAAVQVGKALEQLGGDAVRYSQITIDMGGPKPEPAGE